MIFLQWLLFILSRSNSTQYCIQCLDPQRKHVWPGFQHKSASICNCFVKPSGTLWLIWIDFNPTMDKHLHIRESVRWNYLSILKLQRFRRWSFEMPFEFSNLYLAWAWDLSSMLGLELLQISKRGPGCLLKIQLQDKTNYSWNNGNYVDAISVTNG